MTGDSDEEQALWAQALAHDSRVCRLDGAAEQGGFVSYSVSDVVVLYSVPEFVTTSSGRAGHIGSSAVAKTRRHAAAPTSAGAWGCR